MREFSKDQPLAIIGAGVMGTKVAWACARAGLQTRLFDVEEGKATESALRAERWSGGEELQRVKHNLAVCATLSEAMDGVQLAFENVPEDLALKQRVLPELAAHLADDAYLGSNASSITVTPLATASGMPDRFFSMNFTDPRTDRLVEMMTNAETGPATIRFALAWADAIGMVPIQVRKEQLGYAFNRLWRVIKKEVLRQVAEGVILPEEIDRAWMLTFGTPYGPCGLMDKVGLKGICNVENIYYEDSSDPSDAPPQFLIDMVNRGELGIPSGKGFYDYPNPAYKQPGFLSGGKSAEK